MAFRSDIYLTGQPVDVLGSVEKGLRMSDLIQQRRAQREEQEQNNLISEALARNSQIDQSGNVSVNQGALLSQLTGKVPAQKLMQVQQQVLGQQKMQSDARMQQADLMKKAIEGGIPLLQAAKQNPAVWGEARNRLINLGFQPQELPEQFDPQWTDQHILLGSDKLKELDMQLKQANLAQTKAQTAKTYADIAKTKSEIGKAGLTEGEKTVDRDYAKDYNDFTGGGETKAIDAINKLKSYRSQMQKDLGFIQAGGGPISGSLPDIVRTQKSISQRDNIVSTANSALKATFGGQLSDGERKALANEFYNDKLSNEENLKIIEQKIMELENGLQTQKQKARYFEENKTLSGFKGQAPQQQSQAPINLDFSVDEIQAEIERRKKK